MSTTTVPTQPGPQKRVDRQRGENNNNAKLTGALVLEYRRAYDAGRVTVAEICERHGLSKGAVHRMLQGRTWAHVGGPLMPARHAPLRGECNGRAKMCDATAVAMRLCAEKGMSVSEIARLFGRKVSCVRDVLSGRSFPHAGGPLRVSKRRPRVPDAVVVEMRQLRAGGMRVAEIARRLRRPYHTVKQVVTGRNYKGVGGPITPAHRGPLRGERHHWSTMSDATRDKIRAGPAPGETRAAFARRLGESAGAVQRMLWQEERRRPVPAVVPLDDGAFLVFNGPEELPKRHAELVRFLAAGEGGKRTTYELRADHFGGFLRMFRAIRARNVWWERGIVPPAGVGKGKKDEQWAIARVPAYRNRRS
jgi:hypothetical protein